MTGHQLPEGVTWSGPWRFINDRTVTAPQWRRFVSQLIPGESAHLSGGWTNCVILKLEILEAERDGPEF